MTRLITLTLSCCLLAGCADSGTTSGTGDAPVTQANLETGQVVSLRVPTMHCPFACWPKVKETLEQQDGVAEVTLAKQKDASAIDNPVVTVALAMLLRQEQPSLRRLLGIGVSVAGVAWLFLRRGASVGGDTNTGDLLMLINCVSYSCYLVLGKSVLRRIPHLVVLAWMFMFGALTVPAFALDVAWVPRDATTTQWLALAGIVIFPTVLAYLGNIIVLSRTAASTTAAYVMIQPLITATLGIGLLGERPEPAVLVTAVGVLSGLWLVTSTPRWAARETP